MKFLKVNLFEYKINFVLKINIVNTYFIILTCLHNDALKVEVAFFLFYLKTIN